MDSLRLLPQLLPYELLGPLIIAAADTINSNITLPGVTLDSTAMLQQQQKQPLQKGLRLISIDLQEPAAKPLQTCVAAYSNLQQLSLQELNIDVAMAQQLGQIASSKGAGSHLKQLCLQSVFMCETAWGLFLHELQQGCGLQVLRCESTLFAANVPATVP